MIDDYKVCHQLYVQNQYKIFSFNKLTMLFYLNNTIVCLLYKRVCFIYNDIYNSFIHCESKI